MKWLVGLLVLFVALLDFWLLIALPLPLAATIVWGFASAALGWWLQRGEDLTLWTELESNVQNGRVPTWEALDAMLLVFAGWALIAPGWLTDTAGGIMMIPHVRRLAIEPIRYIVRVRLG